MSLTAITYSILLFISLLLHSLEVGLAGFPKVSLAGFIEGLRSDFLNRFDFIKRHGAFLNTLRGTNFILKGILIIWAYQLITAIAPLERGLLIIGTYFLVYHLILYFLVISHRSTFLKFLLFLHPLPWTFFLPFTGIIHAVQKLTGQPARTENDDPSDKEREVFIDEGAKAGVIEHKDRAMVASVLEFGDTYVKEIMTPRVDMFYLDIKTHLSEVAAFIREKKKSRFPVVNGRIDNIEGIVLAKDIFDIIDAPDFLLSQVLRPPFFVPETMRIQDLLKEMQRSRQKFAVVADEFGGVSGLVTMEDIIEEIVGDIQDEFDNEEDLIVKSEEGFIVRGDTDIYELSETLGIALNDDEDYQTVAGLISYKLRRIAKVGDQVVIPPYTAEVLSVEKTRIHKVIFKHDSL